MLAVATQCSLARGLIACELNWEVAEKVRDLNVDPVRYLPELRRSYEMRFATLGRTGVHISVVTLGAAFFGGRISTTPRRNSALR